MAPKLAPDLPVLGPPPPGALYWTVTDPDGTVVQHGYSSGAMLAASALMGLAGPPAQITIETEEDPDHGLDE